MINTHVKSAPRTFITHPVTKHIYKIIIYLYTPANGCDFLQTIAGDLPYLAGGSIRIIMTTAFSVPCHKFNPKYIVLTCHSEYLGDVMEK